MSDVRPPWVVVIRLPDDTPPADAPAAGLAFPMGSIADAFAGELAERIIAERDAILREAGLL